MANEKRLTYKQSIDGHEDVGLCEGVTVAEAICKLADLEEAERWIPVTERLPEQHDTVIGWTGEFMGEVHYNGKEFVWLDDDGWYDTAHVTHWMEMPEPPKGE